LTDIRRRVADLYFLRHGNGSASLCDDETVRALVMICEGLGPRALHDPRCPGLDSPDWRAYAVARDRLARLAGRLAQRINGAPIRPMDAGPF
jgi:hypothetical protein